MVKKRRIGIDIFGRGKTGESDRQKEEKEVERHMSDGSLHSGWFYLPVEPQE